MTAPILVGYTTTSTSSTSNNVITGTPPVEATAGRVLLAFVILDNGNTSGQTIVPTTPGWNQVFLQGNSLNNCTLYWRLVLDTDPATHSFVTNLNGRLSLGLIAVAGAAGGTPISAWASTAYANVSTAFVCPALTTIANNSLVLRMVSSYNAVFFTPPAEVTEYYDYAANSIGNWVGYDTVATPAGAQPTRTLNHSSTYGFAISVAIQPDVPPGERRVSALGAYAPILLSGNRKVSAVGAYAVMLEGSPPPTDPPLAPSGLAVTGVTLDSVALSWTDQSSDEDSFQIERSSDGISFTTIATVGAGVTTYTDDSLTPGTIYYYRVFAHRGGVLSTSSNTVQAQTVGLPPTAPSNLQVTSVELMAISLAWTDQSNNENGFWIDRSQDGETFSTVATVGAGVTAYTDPWLMPDTLYYYQVRAYRGELISSPSNTVQAETLGVDPPTGLSAEVLSATSVHLTWQDNAQIEQAYTVERSLDNGQTWQEIAKLPANQTYFTDAALAPETWYCYRVRALYPLVYLRSGLYSGRGLDLWDGMFHVAPPQGWEMVDFDESAWTPYLYLGQGTTPPKVAPDCTPVRAYTGRSVVAHRGNLIRSRFTLPAGPILSARLRMNIEDYMTSCYINGQALTLPAQSLTPGSAYNHMDITLDPSLFQPGPNVLAMHFNNESGSAHAISYLLELY